MAIYQWNKYSTVKTSGYVESVSSTLTTLTGTDNIIKVGTSYTFDPKNGTFALVGENPTAASQYKGNMLTTHPYFLHNSMIYLVDSFSVLFRWTMKGYQLVSTLTEVYNKGDLVGVVKSGSDTDYPANGLHSDGYWYEYIGEIRTIGNLKINGTLYDLTGEGYVKINGVMCPITSSLVKHGGTLSDMFIGG